MVGQNLDFQTKFPMPPRRSCLRNMWPPREWGPLGFDPEIEPYGWELKEDPNLSRCHHFPRGLTLKGFIFLRMSKEKVSVNIHHSPAAEPHSLTRAGLL